MIISIDNLTKAIDYYDNKITQPFNTIVIQTFEDFKEFITVTKIRRVNMYKSLVIFKSEDKALMKICKSPTENYFNLVFNVRMLVVCCGVDIYLREWYSIHPNEIISKNFATWTYEDGLINLDDKSLYQRRHSLEGISLRVTSIIVNKWHISNYILIIMIKH